MQCQKRGSFIEARVTGSKIAWFFSHVASISAYIASFVDDEEIAIDVLGNSRASSLWPAESDDFFLEPDVDGSEKLKRLVLTRNTRIWVVDTAI